MAQGKAGYHHSNLRAALVESGLELIAEEGEQALTLRALARRAGVSHTAPYRHFPDKTALLAAIAEEGFHAMTDAMQAATQTAGEDPLARFRAQGRAYMEFARARPARFRVMFGVTLAGSGHAELDEARGTSFQSLLDGIAECQRAGRIRGADTRALAVMVWSAVHGHSILALDQQLAGERADSPDADALMDNLLGNLFLGLQPGPGERDASAG